MTKGIGPTGPTTVNVLVACHDPLGKPTMVPVRVATRFEHLDACEHYQAALAVVAGRGFSVAKAVCFDSYDHVTKPLFEAAAWRNVSVVCVDCRLFEVTALERTLMQTKYRVVAQTPDDAVNACRQGQVDYYESKPEDDPGTWMETRKVEEVPFL